MNNNTDGKATWQLNCEVHSENNQRSKTEFSLGNSVWLAISAKTSSQMLNGAPIMKNIQ